MNTNVNEKPGRLTGNGSYQNILIQLVQQLRLHPDSLGTGSMVFMDIIPLGWVSLNYKKDSQAYLNF